MKVQRNSLCPCGSGHKFKKCCGASVKSVNQPAISSSPRSCGECSACCQGWLTTHALNQDIYLDNPCSHCSSQGCNIHAERPTDPCRIFFCAWAEAGSDFPEWMQPNQSGVITLTNRTSWNKMPVDVLVSTSKDPDTKILQWFQKRCHTQHRPFIYQQNKQWFGYGPQQFQQDLAAKVARGESLWDGALISESKKI